MAACCSSARDFKPAWVAGTATQLGGQDPREHGDRPQRHARPVGLDERPADPLLDLGLGHGLDRRGVEALPQLRPPHLHEHPRQGQGPRLRDHADRPEPEVAPGLPLPAALQRAADGALRVGRRLPRPRPRGDPRGREVARRRCSRSSRASAARPATRSSRTTSPGRDLSARGRRGADRGRSSSRRGEPTEGARTRLRRRDRAVVERKAELGRARSSGADLQRRQANAPPTSSRNLWSHAIIFCGHFPDQTYTFSQEETEDESRGGWYVRQLAGAANIEGGPFFHVCQRQPRLPGRAPPVPGHAVEPLRARSRRG